MDACKIENRKRGRGEGEFWKISKDVRGIVRNKEEFRKIS